MITINLIDHLILASPSLEEGNQYISKLLGIKPVKGGKHVGFGTHNTLLGLGDATYLEIIAPDPEQDTPPDTWIPAHLSTKPRLIGWAIATSKMEQLVELHKDWFGELRLMSRKKPDGSIISWKMTLPRFDLFDGMIPFLIDWSPSSHPSKTLPQAGVIHSYELAHPQADQINSIFDQLEIDIRVSKSAHISIDAVISLNGQLIKI